MGSRKKEWEDRLVFGDLHIKRLFSRYYTLDPYVILSSLEVLPCTLLQVPFCIGRALVKEEVKV